MKTQAIILAALAVAPSALAHTVWSTFYVDGKDQGAGVAMRMRKDPAKASFPLEDYGSTDMACNVDGTTGVSRVQSVSDGSTITFEMRSWPNDPSKQSLDSGHEGPCAVYLKKVDSAVDDKAAGDGWFKLFDNGYDASSEKWCTDLLIANKGRLSVALPKGLQGGAYLARPEVVALHNATKGGAQFYTGCAQIYLESSGNLVPESTVSIPGYVKAGEDSVKFNIYMNDNAKYKVPGPAVAKLVASSGPANAGGATAQTEGLRPQDAIIENANWFGKEVPSYTDETGCWASGTKCWDQLDACYEAAPPTGNSGCKIFQEKCQSINDACQSKNFNGPPNEGQDLTPQKETIDVGPLLETVVGDVASSSPQTTSADADAAQASDVNADKPKTTATTTADTKPTTTPVASPPYKAGSTSNIPAQTPSVVEKPTLQTTLTVPASENAPKPTNRPTCPKGYRCHTEYEVQYETVTQYVTLGAQKRRGMHQRRHGVAA